MWARTLHARACNSRRNQRRAESLPAAVRSVPSWEVGTRLADMHIAPAARRWTTRVALAVVVAVGIGYLPATVARRDPRAQKLDGQLDQLEGEARTLAAGN